MPYISGESLAARLQRDGPMSVTAGVTLIREIADALAHAHSLGVIHRDVKPANVLLEADHAVVTDFGIAHIDATKLTATGLGLGTFGYMAPEQFLGASTIDARADVYALGIVAYETLTGRSPFATSAGATAFAPQMRGRPASPRELQPEIPSAVAAAILKALELDPDARFATMAEFRDVLGPAQTIPADARRRRVLAVGAVVVAFLAAAGWLLGRRDRGSGGASSIVEFAAPPSTRPSAATAVTLVAVAPFDLLRRGIDVWREGMVDVLSRNLDGMGDLHAVSPTTVLQSWRGRADAASALALGRAVKANIVIAGTLRGDGDSVRAIATLYDVLKGERILEVERVDHVEHMDRLADSLTLGIVSALGGTHGGRGPRLAAVGTRSMPALKAFLQGEQFFRRFAYDSAAAMFVRATDVDPGFALAYHGQARAYGWIPDYPKAFEATRAAVARNHGLSERDSMLVIASALLVEMKLAHSDRGKTAARATQFLRAAVLRYPEDAELRYLWADLVFHTSSKETATLSTRERLALFDRAIEADSGLGESYAHAVQLALYSHDIARLRRYGAAIEGNPRLGGLTGNYGPGRWFFAPPGRSQAECQQWADTTSVAPQLSRFMNFSGIKFWSDSAGSLVRCLEALAQRPTILRDDDTRRSVSYFAAMMLRAGGRLSRASAVLGRDADVADARDFAALAMQGVVNADSAERMLKPLASDSTQGASNERAFVWPFWAWRKDTASIRIALAVEQRAAAGLADADDAAAGLTLLRAVLSARNRADTAAAIRAIEGATHLRVVDDIALRSSLLPWLYERTGRTRDALTMLDRPVFPYTALERVLVELRIGRLADQLGDRARAALAYAIVRDAFAHADPSFDAIRREANDGLKRLQTYR